MFVSRFFVIVPVLAVAGSLAAQPITPRSAGTRRLDLGLGRLDPGLPEEVASLCGSSRVIIEKVRKEGLERFDEFALVAPLTKSLDLGFGNPDAVNDLLAQLSPAPEPRHALA